MAPLRRKAGDQVGKRAHLGDLSSETLQSGYIKWPRVPLLADSYEGYELSSSTNHNAGLSNEYFPWHAFNELPHYADNWTPSWASLTNTFSSGAANTSRTTGEDTFNHEWIQVKFPQAIRVSYLRMKGTTGSHSGGFTPKSGRVYASNDGGITWTKVSTFSGLSYASGDDYATVNVGECGLVHTTGASVLRKLPVALPSFRWMRSGSSKPPRAWARRRRRRNCRCTGVWEWPKVRRSTRGTAWSLNFVEHDRPLVKYPEVLSYGRTADRFRGYTATSAVTPAVQVSTASEP